MDEVWARVLANLTDRWAIWGFAAQAIFFSRFLVQWIASERAKRSVIPTAFWYLSLLGSFMLFTYAFFGRQDPVIAIGQTTGFLIYSRNLMLLARQRQEEAPG